MEREQLRRKARGPARIRGELANAEGKLMQEKAELQLLNNEIGLSRWLVHLGTHELSFTSSAWS